jgi:hypothetical protein
MKTAMMQKQCAAANRCGCGCTCIAASTQEPSSYKGDERQFAEEAKTAEMRLQNPTASSSV